MFAQLQFVFVIAYFFLCQHGDKETSSERLTERGIRRKIRQHFGKICGDMVSVDGTRRERKFEPILR